MADLARFSQFEEELGKFGISLKQNLPEAVNAFKNLAACDYDGLRVTLLIIFDANIMGPTQGHVIIYDFVLCDFFRK